MKISQFTQKAVIQFEFSITFSLVLVIPDKPLVHRNHIQRPDKELTKEDVKFNSKLNLINVNALIDEIDTIISSVNDVPKSKFPFP